MAGPRAAVLSGSQIFKVGGSQMFRRLAAAALAASFVVMGTPEWPTPTTRTRARTRTRALEPEWDQDDPENRDPRAAPQPVGQGFQDLGQSRRHRRRTAKSRFSGSGTAPPAPRRAVVGKIKSGQIAGAAITAVGLADIHKPILALQLPGALHRAGTSSTRRARSSAPDFEKAMTDSGLLIERLWRRRRRSRDVEGFRGQGTRQISRGKTPGDDPRGHHRPEDLRGHRRRAGRSRQRDGLLAEAQLRARSTS